MANSNDNGGVGFWTGFIIGGVAGLVAGVLFAPKSGEETRALISEKTAEWRDRAEELAASARDRARSAIEEGRAAAARARSGLDPEDHFEYEDEL